ANEVSGTVTLYEVLQDEVCANVPDISTLVVDACPPTLSIDFDPVEGAIAYLIEATLVSNPDRQTVFQIPEVPFSGDPNLPNTFQNGDINVRIAAIFEDGSRSDFSVTTVLTIDCDNNTDGIEARNTLLRDFRIYPNPVSEYLILEGLNSTSTVRVLDITGKLVLEQVVDTQLEVSNLPKGVYTLEVQSNQEWIKEKFVKQ
ncbi:MAG: T9SS type A sorting domain-containing protein, partial [Bacteroidota bacterium]